MIRRRFLAGLVSCLFVTSCSWMQRTSAEHTLLGVSQQQALVAAHRVLIDQSYEIATIDRAGGTLTTAWRDRPSRSLRYVVRAGPTQSSGEGAISSVDLEVRAEARDRAVRGWTEEYPVTAEADRLMRRISREVGEVSLEPAPSPQPAAPAEEEPREPECRTSRECPPGQHCGTGRCVWECATDDECDGAAVCDRRGRCVQPPPPPPAGPEPSPASEETEE